MKITIEQLKQAIQSVKARANSHGNSKDAIAYPSVYYIAETLDISELELIQQAKEENEFDYELVKFREFCLNYHKDRAARTNQATVINQILKEDFQFGSQENKLVEVYINYPTEKEFHNDTIEEYDAAEKEFKNATKNN